MEQLLRDYPTSIQITDGEVLDPSPVNLEKRITRLKLPDGDETGDVCQKARGATPSSRRSIFALATKPC
jgi:hypothetical protein